MMVAYAARAWVSAKQLDGPLCRQLEEPMARCHGVADLEKHRPASKENHCRVGGIPGQSKSMQASMLCIRCAAVPIELGEESCADKIQ
jgi:hypothetical protein